MPRERLEVADIFRAHGPAWRTAGHLSLTRRAPRHRARLTGRDNHTFEKAPGMPAAAGHGAVRLKITESPQIGQQHPSAPLQSRRQPIPPGSRLAKSSRPNRPRNAP